MRQRLYDALDQFYDWWLDTNITFSTYKIGGIIMLTLYIACRLDSKNPIFGAIQINAPYLTETFWEFTFLICGVGMFLLKPGRWEVPGVLFLFCFPMAAFYGLLVLIFATHGRANLFFVTLTSLAAITPIILVTRSSVFNFYRDSMNSILARNKALEQEKAILLMEVAQLRQPHSESEH